MRPSGLHKGRDAEAWGREEKSKSSQQFNDSHSLVQTYYIPGLSYIIYRFYNP